MVDWLGPLTQYFGALTLPLQLGLVYVLVYPIGSLVWSHVTSHSTLDKKFSMEIPFKIAMGLTVSTVLTFFLGLVWLPLGLAVLFSSFFAFFGKSPRIHLKSVAVAKISASDVTIVGLAIFWWALGSLLVWNEKWPPAGDSVLHGMIVSAALQQGRTPSTLVPISTIGNLLTTYPLGFHTLAASLDYALALPPGQSVLLTALAITITLPLLVFALTFYLSRSLVAGLISNLPFILPSVPSGRFLEAFPLGYLYNGVYPAILATLVLLLTMAWASLHLKTAPKTTVIALPLLLTLTLFVTYPPFMFFPLAIAIMSQVPGKRNKILATAAFIATIFYLTPYVKMTLAPSGFGTPANLAAYRLSIPYFSANPFLLAAVGVGLSYGVFLAVRRRSILGLFVTVLTAIMLGSLYPFVYDDLVWFTAPSRLFISLLITAFVFLGVLLNRFFTIATSHHFRISKQKLVTFVLAVGLVTLIGWSSITQVGTASRTWWNPYNKDDWNAAQWIEHNIPANALLLNDRSYAGVFITSFSARSVVNNLFFQNNMSQADRIFDRPWDQQLQKKIFTQFPIRFIYVSADPVYWNTVAKSYFTGLPREPLENLLDFSSYLKPVFQSGNAKVYEVTLNSQSNPNDFSFPLGNELSIYSEAQNSSSLWHYENSSLNVTVMGEWAILQSLSPTSFNASTYPRLIIAVNASSNAYFGIWAGNTTLVSNIFLHYNNNGLVVEEYQLSKALGSMSVDRLGFEVGTTDGGTATVNWLLVGFSA